MLSNPKKAYLIYSKFKQKLEGRLNTSLSQFLLQCIGGLSSLFAPILHL